jgi:hypothetical protein
MVHAEAIAEEPGNGKGNPATQHSTTREFGPSVCFLNILYVALLREKRCYAVLCEKLICRLKRASGFRVLGCDITSKLKIHSLLNEKDMRPILGCGALAGCSM